MDTERNVHRLCDTLIYSGRQRWPVLNLILLIRDIKSPIMSETSNIKNTIKCSMFRGMIERDRDLEERRRDEMGEKLSVYKREVKSVGNQSWPIPNWNLQVANVETTARVMRDEEARLEQIYMRWRKKDLESKLKLEIKISNSLRWRLCFVAGLKRRQRGLIELLLLQKRRPTGSTVHLITFSSDVVFQFWLELLFSQNIETFYGFNSDSQAWSRNRRKRG